MRSAVSRRQSAVEQQADQVKQLETLQQQVATASSERDHALEARVRAEQQVRNPESCTKGEGFIALSPYISKNMHKPGPSWPYHTFSGIANALAIAGMVVVI